MPPCVYPWWVYLRVCTGCVHGGYTSGCVPGVYNGGYASGCTRWCIPGCGREGGMVGIPGCGREGGIRHPLHCWSLSLCLSDTRFTVGLSLLSLSRTPVSLLVLYSLSLSRTPFHCWFCTPRSLSATPPYHPFHCWARLGPVLLPVSLLG